MGKTKIFELASLRVTLKMWVVQVVAGIISMVVWLLGWFIALKSGSEWFALFSIIVAIMIYVLFGFFLSGWLARVWWKWK